MDALTGVINGRLGSLDLRQAAQLRLDRLRVQAEAGELDIAKLQERLRSVFGEDRMRLSATTAALISTVFNNS